MQHLRALARHKLKLVAAIAFILGGLVLGMNWSGTAAADPAIATAEPQDIVAAMAETDGEAPRQPTAELVADEQVVVYVSGAVRAPDVYQLSKAARIKDLVLAAGGFTDDADPERINLAERVDDGQHIHVPRQGEATPTAAAATSNTADAGQPIDINTASAAELDGLPGIGQALAQRIIDYRTTNGSFKAIEDLRNVKGIGPALFEKITPLITVGS
jgi:competence protein ComEA